MFFVYNILIHLCLGTIQWKPIEANTLNRVRSKRDVNQINFKGSIITIYDSAVCDNKCSRCCSISNNEYFCCGKPNSSSNPDTGSHRHNDDSSEHRVPRSSSMTDLRGANVDLATVQSISNIHSMTVFILLFVLAMLLLLFTIAVIVYKILKESDKKTCQMQKFMKSAWEAHYGYNYNQNKQPFTEEDKVHRNTDSEDCINPYAKLLTNQRRTKKRNCGSWTVRATRGGRSKKPCAIECFDRDFETESVNSGNLKAALKKVIKCKNKYRELKNISRKRKCK